ncbi:Uncharacterised protein [uncultured archaeon]|nr:Uncharacterised protein [uncultured archaeon]
MPNRWAGSDFGIVAWWGHGNDNGAYVGFSSCSDGAFMLSSNAPSLDNIHPSHTYQCSCTNGNPDRPGNLQYAILKNGGITTTGATRVSWYYPSQTSFAGSPSNAGMGYEYVKRLVQGQAAGDALYNMKSSGVSAPGGNEELMNFYDFCLDGDPAISVNNHHLADDRIEIFVQGEDGHLWHLWQTAPNGDWSNWEDLSVHRPLSTNVTGEPGVGRAADGRIEIFVQGEDGHLWHLQQTAPNGDWSNWEDLSVHRPLSKKVVGEPGVDNMANY